MMDQKAMDDTFAAVNSALGMIRVEFATMNRIMAEIPKTEGELKELLAELAAATEDKVGHHKRYPRREGQGTYESDGFDTETVREDWHRCLGRFDTAVAKLVRFAQLSQK